MTDLLTLNEEHIPKLPRHAKLRYDEPRKKWIINAPERVFELDEIAAEIIQLVNGEFSIEIIINELTEKFNGAPRDVISKDIRGNLRAILASSIVS